MRSSGEFTNLIYVGSTMNPYERFMAHKNTHFFDKYKNIKRTFLFENLNKTEALFIGNNYS